MPRNRRFMGHEDRTIGMRSVLAVAILLVGFSGCVQPEPWTVPTEEGDRRVVVHVPEGDGPFPLLLALHGGLGTPKSMQEKSQFNELADAHGFIVAYPEGMDRTWNSGHCCGKARDNNVDDVAFLEAVIARVDDEVGVTKVGVTGHSNGAMMAYRLAAESDEIDFVAAVAGAIGGQKNRFVDPYHIPNPGRPVDVLIIHARDDPNVPYEGGSGPSSVDPFRIDLSVEDAVDFWIAVNQARLVEREEGTVLWETYEGTANVTLIATEGGHGWPGSAKEIALTSNPPTPDASVEIMRAFLQD